MKPMHVIVLRLISEYSEISIGELHKKIKDFCENHQTTPNLPCSKRKLYSIVNLLENNRMISSRLQRTKPPARMISVSETGRQFLQNIIPSGSNFSPVRT